ncbi:hypothetical protein [Stenotrophomonas sp. S39]|uniref:hypothetical protein n=1 Tax=Stenotrophomonas sp. S39 TaxID=2767451 RepID=UPI001909CD79|nr:hypothetical protein [Stenotrophomonas sp. S39]MBK0055859.1 hypothetical protein [Stenotrophomonas sp. S39]
MPNTGRFFVLAVDADRDPAGAIVQIRSMALRCEACGEVTRTEGTQIARLSGGTVLACAHCGATQAVANARLEECDHVIAVASPATASASALPLPGRGRG